MTNVFFVGGEDTSFNPISSPYVTAVTGDGTYRTAWARCSLHVAQPVVRAQDEQLPTANPATCRLRSPTFASQPALWVHAQFSNAGDNSEYVRGSDNDQYLMAAFDAGGVYRIAVRATDASSGQVKFSICNAAGAWTDLATSANEAIVAQAGPQALDWHIVYGSSGSLALYNNGSLILSYSGNIVTDACTGIAGIDFVGIGGGESLRFCGAWSELVIQDTDTRGLNVLTLAPVANGNTNVWTGAVGAVADVIIDDTTFISTTTANQVAEYTSAGAVPAGTWTISMFWQEARILAGSSGGPQHFEYVVRAGAVDYAAGMAAPNAYFNNYSYPWLVNPNTNAPWQASDFGAGFNFGIQSIA